MEKDPLLKECREKIENAKNDIQRSLDSVNNTLKNIENLTPNSYCGLSHTMKADDSRQEEWKKQREEHGFDSTELWNLDNTISKFIYPRLKAFRQNIGGYPACFESIKEWEDILEKMEKAFELMAEGDNLKWTKKDIKQINQGLRLFTKYYFDLWN